jgi:ribosomal protein L7/L12
MPDYPPLFIGMVLLVTIILIAVLGNFVYNLAQPKVTRWARVTGKRKGMSTRGRSSSYHCTFEFEDGQREEYDVSVDTYVSLAANDVGNLDTKGKLFWGFRPERAGARDTSAPAAFAGVSVELLAQIKEALFQRRKIEAIRLYREATGAPLAEAKAGVEQLEASLRAAEPDKFA